MAKRRATQPMELMQKTLQRLKSRGVRTVGVVDFYKATKLPPMTIIRCVHRLEKKGLLVPDDN